MRSWWGDELDFVINCTNNNIYDCSIPTRKRINIFKNNVKSKTIKLQLW